MFQCQTLVREEYGRCISWRKRICHSTGCRMSSLADHRQVGISVYLVESPPGRSTRRHRHPYDEVAFVREGRGRWTVDGEQREAGPGDILVVKAGQIHEFIN